MPSLQSSPGWAAVPVALFCPWLAAAACLLTGSGTDHAGRIEFTEYDLPNGLHVILAPEHSVPVVASYVLYHVGSKNERPDRTGFAHFFEHLMFEGSDNILARPVGQARQRRGRQPERFHQSFDQTELLHQPARQPVQARAVDRERAHDARQGRADRRGHAAAGREGGTPPLLRQPTLRQPVRGTRQARICRHAVFLGAHRQRAIHRPGHAGRVSGSFTRRITFRTTRLTCCRATSIPKRRRRTSKRISARSRAGPNRPGHEIATDLLIAPAVTTRKGQPPTPVVGEVVYSTAPGPTSAPSSYTRYPQPGHTVEIERQNTPLPATLHAWQAPTETDPDSYAVDLLTNIMATGRSSRLYRRMVDEEQAADAGRGIPVLPGKEPAWSACSCSG